MHDLPHGVNHGRRLKRRPPGDHVIKQRPQPVYIRRGGHARTFTAGLLRSHVAGGADHCLRVTGVAAGFKGLRQTEISDQRLVAGVHQNIRRFQVAMEHSFAVGVGDGAGDGQQ